jgi:hypothetical protein
MGAAPNPLRLSADALADWEHRYTTVVKETSSTWRTRKAWPRWEAMALHFASFYLPLGLPSIVAESAASPENASQRRLLNDLAPHIHPDVVQLVGLWLAAAGAPRDEAGIPVVEWSPSVGRRLPGRTESEILLLG